LANRAIDINMKSFQNAREREAGDWKTLFDQADPRFRFLGVHTPPRARDSIIEAEWAPPVQNGVFKPAL
jgi:hypothetical protein